MTSGTPVVLLNQTMPTTSKITDTLKKYWWVIIILIAAYLFYKMQQAKKTQENQKS